MIPVVSARNIANHQIIPVVPGRNLCDPEEDTRGAGSQSGDLGSNSGGVSSPLPEPRGTADGASVPQPGETPGSPGVTGE